MLYQLYSRYCRSVQKSLCLIAVLTLPACGFFSGLTGSGEVQDSAPNVRLDPKKIPDARPRVEAKSRGGNRSIYTVNGKSYRVMDDASGFRERGEASWYGKKFHGRLTANGERYDMYAMTAAHKHLPLPTYVKVKNLENGKTIIVRVNDRGPFHGGRIIDLSYAAATKLDMLKKGTAKVEVEVIDARQWLAERKSAQRAAKQKKRQVEKQARSPAVSEGSDNAYMYLQVAAYQSLAAAQSTQNRLLEQINAAQLSAQSYNVVIHPTEGNALYRVRIGPLANRPDIEALKQHPLLDSFGNMLAVVEKQ